MHTRPTHQNVIKTNFCPRSGWRKLLPSLFLLAIILLLHSCRAENYVKKGDAFYAIGEYYDAAAEYKKAYSRTAIKVLTSMVL